MSGSGRLVDYLGFGLASARPTSLTLVPGGLGIYFATDTKVFSLWVGTAWTSPPGSGTVTGVSVATANGFLGTVATPNSTPVITLETSVAGLLKGNGTGVVAAAKGTDYAAPDTANVFTNQQAVTPYRANISGVVSIDLAGTAKSNNLHLTITGNVTSFALTNPVDGAVYNIRFIQNATGGWTFAALPAAFKFSGGAPSFSTTANAVDFLSAEYGSTEGTYVCSFLKGVS